MELAYLAPRGHNETIKAYRKSFYMTIRTILRAVTREQKMRVQRSWSHIDWAFVWKNLSDAPVSE